MRELGNPRRWARGGRGGADDADRRCGGPARLTCWIGLFRCGGAERRGSRDITYVQDVLRLGVTPLS